jgi:hypothetical protein
MLLAHTPRLTGLFPPTRSLTLAFSPWRRRACGRTAVARRRIEAWAAWATACLLCCRCRSAARATGGPAPPVRCCGGERGACGHGPYACEETNLVERVGHKGLALVERLPRSRASLKVGDALHHVDVFRSTKVHRAMCPPSIVTPTTLQRLSPSSDSITCSCEAGGRHSGKSVRGVPVENDVHHFERLAPALRAVLLAHHRKQRRSWCVTRVLACTISKAISDVKCSGGRRQAYNPPWRGRTSST